MDLLAEEQETHGRHGNVVQLAEADDEIGDNIHRIQKVQKHECDGCDGPIGDFPEVAGCIVFNQHKGEQQFFDEGAQGAFAEKAIPDFFGALADVLDVGFGYFFGAFTNEVFVNVYSSGFFCSSDMSFLP